MATQDAHEHHSNQPLQEEEVVKKAVVFFLRHLRKILAVSVIVIILVVIGILVNSANEERMRQISAHIDFGVEALKNANIAGTEEVLRANVGRAIEEFRRARKRAEGTPLEYTASFYLGRCYVQLGNYQQAITYFNNLEARKSHFLAPRAMQETIYAYISLNKYEDALYYVKEFRNRFPSSYLLPDVVLTASKIYVAQKNKELAANVIREFVAKSAEGFLTEDYKKLFEERLKHIETGVF